MKVETGQVVNTYEKMLNKGVSALQEAQIMEASHDAWLLFSYITSMERSAYFLHKQDSPSTEEIKNYHKMIQKRSQHIPLQHLTGEQEFMGISFYVNEKVLIPRQDTEILVETALPYVQGKKVLDMCTGSGCIAISLVLLGNPRECIAVDLSREALAVAKKNALANHAAVRLVESNLFENVAGSFDVIVSNPPYISPEEIEGLMSEVKDFEPRMALDGGEDGLFFYRRITEKAIQFLNNGGYLFYEIGCEQAEAVMALLKKAGFHKIQCVKDYAGLDRVVFGEYRA